MIKRTTLSDVAREAGVSVQTASHVMTGNMTVRLPEATRIRVQDAAKKVGYRPNRFAQAMKTGKTNTIGIWLPVHRPIPTFMRFLGAVHEELSASKYEMLVVPVSDALAWQGEGQAPPYWPVDGLMAIDAGKAVKHFRSDPQNDATPIVVVGLEDYANGDNVSWAIAEAAQDVTEKLIEGGARRVVHLTLDWILRDFPREQRRRGYTEAMCAAELDPILIGSDEESISGAKRFFAEYLRKNSVPDAVFASTDALAVGAASALLAAGVRIPDDCKVWGYGDFPESECFQVPISTLRVPIRQIVTTGWQFLRERIADSDLVPRLKILPMEFIVRESG